ncbi:MAG: hypothetical protein QGH51_03135 [Planctomycetota bacterium]|nr:hypothetical protein [Planctomycetota bacterium]
MPNIGLTMGGGQVFSSEANGDAKAVELIGTWQPIDDEFFANDGNPAAEDWSQVSLGINQYNLEERRRWHLRYGVVWARAEGEPNMVQLPGDYNGVYAAYGFSTEYKEGWRIGPELQLNAIGMEGGKDSKSVWFVPQLLFRTVWVF